MRIKSTLGISETLNNISSNVCQMIERERQREEKRKREKKRKTESKDLI